MLVIVESDDEEHLNCYFPDLFVGFSCFSKFLIFYLSSELSHNEQINRFCPLPAPEFNGILICFRDILMEMTVLKFLILTRNINLSSMPKLLIIRMIFRPGISTNRLNPLSYLALSKQFLFVLTRFE